MNTIRCKINFLSNLSQNLLEILEDEEYYDVTIEVDNNDNLMTNLM